MHYLYFVAINKEVAGDDPVAKVNEILEGNSFAGNEGGHWGSSRCDWYQVGGRWSGYLTEILLDDFNEKAKALIKSKRTEQGSEYVSFKEIEENEVELQQLWESLFRNGN